MTIEHTKSELARFHASHNYSDASDPNHPQAATFREIQDTFQRTNPSSEWTTRGGKFVLGKGADGSVRLAFNRVRNQAVAVKSLPGKAGSAGDIESALHRRVQSKYVVALYDVFHVAKTNKEGLEVSKSYMSMECGSPSLWDLAASGAKFKESDISQALQHVVQGVMDCHNEGVLIRDVRMRNVIKVNEVYKIIDFGAAIDVNDRETMDMWCIADIEDGRRQAFQEMIELAEDLLSFSDMPQSESAKSFLALKANTGETDALKRLLQHSFLAAE